MIQTLFVYIFLCVFMCVFLWNYAVITVNGKMNRNVYLWLSILLFAIVFGMRYGVGIDYLSYLDYYKNPYAYAEKENGMEFGFDFASKILYNLGFHFAFFFGLISLFQIYFILYGIKKYPFVLPFVVFCLITSGVVWGGFSNVIRQSLAFAIFVYSIQFIADKKIVKYFLYITLAVSMHVSAIILFPLYFITYIKTDFTKSIRVQFILYVASIIIAKIGIFEQIVNFIDGFVSLIGYEKTFNIMALNQETNLVFNVDFVLRNSIIVVIILFSNNVKLYFSKMTYTIIYELFFVGVLFKQIFSGSMSLERLNIYFFNLFYIVSGFTLCYLFFKKRYSTKSKYFFCFVSMLFVLLFVKEMYSVHLSKSTSKYVFFFETDRYMEKQLERQKVVYGIGVGN